MEFHECHVLQITKEKNTATFPSTLNGEVLTAV